MYCPNCGNELSSEVLFCPYCGAAIGRSQSAPQQPEGQTPPPNYSQNEPCCPQPGPVPPPPPPAEPAAGLALASQICGILSIILFCCVPWAVPVAAIVLGAIAKTQGNRTSKPTVGIVLGIISLVLAVILGVILGVVYLGELMSLPVGEFYYDHYYF